VNTALSANCKTNVGLVVGLSVGIPIFFILLVLLVIIALRYYSSLQAKKFKNNQDVEMN
jgi:uncharacterized membrane protein